MSAKFQWRVLEQEPLKPVAMVLYDATLFGGDGGYRQLEAADLAVQGSANNLQTFNFALASGLLGVNVPYQTNFSGVPVVTSSLVSPSGFAIVATAISNISTSGFFLGLSAAIPSTGYSLNVIASL